MYRRFIFCKAKYKSTVWQALACQSGTGSFLVDASKYTDNLIGCENGEERYALAKCNFILKDLSIEHLYFNNCFNQQFESYDHIILNPPFSCNSSDNGEIEDIYGWRKLKNEQKFVIYQLQYLKDGGIGCCIIPRSNFNNSTNKSLDFKKLLLKYCDIIKIVNCNSKVFAPAANVECTICVFKKCKSSNFETEIIDYSDDGYTVKKNIRLKTSEPNPKSYKTILKLNEDWNYVQPLDIPKNIKQLIANFNIDYNTVINKQKVLSRDYNISYIEYIKIGEVREWKQIKIGDYFDIVKPKKIFKINQTKDGEYPLISSTSLNNGITKYINDYSIELNECLTIARNGSVGYCFYQTGKFGITTDIIIIKLKENLNSDLKLDLKLFSVLTTYYLTKKYNYSNKISIDKLKNEIINFPKLFISECE